MKPSILFMGSPEFARISLKTLFDSGFPVLGVVTQPDKRAGRGQQVTPCASAHYAREQGIPLFQPPSAKDPEFIRQVISLKPDFVVVSAYGKILTEELIKIPHYACVNIHASLLPAYRGAAPINWCLLNGEIFAGISLMQVVLKLDAGPVYCKKSISIDPLDTAGTLTTKLADLGARMLIQSLDPIVSGDLKPVDQDESEATYAPLLKKEDGKIDWQKSAHFIHNQVRAFNPWPGAYTFVDPSTSLGINPEHRRRVDNKMLKIYHGLVQQEKTDAPCGTIYFISRKGIHVSCGEFGYCLEEVQLEGKKRMPAVEFVRGYRLEIGKKLL